MYGTRPMSYPVIMIKPQELIETLMRCRSLVRPSDESAFTTGSTPVICHTLDESIDALANTGRLTGAQQSALKLLFAPTGALQETATENGWGEDYLRLSERFDDLIESTT